MSSSPSSALIVIGETECVLPRTDWGAAVSRVSEERLDRG